MAAKHWLYGRLSTDAEKAAEDRATHFSEDLDPSYFAGLVSETYDPRKNRFEKRRGARNEPLDTWVYAYAAAHHPELRLHRRTRADWEAAAQRLRPVVPAALTADAAMAPDAQPLPLTQPATPRPAPRKPLARNW